MNKYLNMFRAGGKGKTFMRSADKLKIGFDEGIKPLTDAIDAELDDKEEEVEVVSDQASGTSSGSTNEGAFKSLDINQRNKDRRKIIKNPGNLNINPFNYASDLDVERMIGNFKGNVGINKKFTKK